MGNYMTGRPLALKSCAHSERFRPTENPESIFTESKPYSTRAFTDPATRRGMSQELQLAPSETLPRLPPLLHWLFAPLHW